MVADRQLPVLLSLFEKRAYFFISPKGQVDQSHQNFGLMRKFVIHSTLPSVEETIELMIILRRVNKDYQPVYF